MDYANYLKSPRWRKLSAKVKAQAGNRCQLCMSEFDLQVHHRSYRYLGTAQEIFDLVCLCGKCHAGFHSKRYKAPKRHKKANVRVNPVREVTKKVVWRTFKDRPMDKPWRGQNRLPFEVQ